MTNQHPQSSGDISARRIIIAIVIIAIIGCGTALSTIGILSSYVTAVLNGLGIIFTFLQWFLPSSSSIWTKHRGIVLKTLMSIIMLAVVIASIAIILPHLVSPTIFFSEVAPNCGSDHATWTAPLPGTSFSCSNGTLVMKQAGTTHYAELDLDAVNSQTYNQTNFHVQVKVGFQEKGDLATYAGLIVQTPQAPGVGGGYILCINSVGAWTLQQVNSNGSTSNIGYGTTSIGNSKLITIAVQVKDSMLSSFIDDQLVAVKNIPIPSSANLLATGLMVERDGGQQSSPVAFSNFILKQ